MIERASAAVLAAAVLLVVLLPLRAHGDAHASPPTQNTKAPASACRAVLTETVGIQRPTLCRSTPVTVTAALTCPTSLPLHVVFVIGRHLAMEDHLDDVKSAARDAVTGVDFGPDTKMGVVSLSAEARSETDLTNRKSVVMSAINGIDLDPIDPFSARYYDWLGEAQSMLEREREPGTSPIEVIVVFTTGCPERYEGYCTRQKGSANKAKGAGMEVVGVCNPNANPFGFGWVLPDDHCRAVQDMASQGRYYPLQRAGAVQRELVELDAVGDGLALDSVRLIETLGDGLQLVPGTVSGQAQTGPQEIEWRWADLAAGTTITASYEVTATRTGALDLRTEDAGLTLIDSLNRTIDPVPVPPRTLTVTECALPTETPTALPTATPTPTATPSPAATDTATPTATATATPTPKAVYLPVALRYVCKPSQIETDAVLVIDASTSMADPSAGTTKITAAKEAAKRFIGQLDLGRDRAAVVAFNSEATRMADMSTDEAMLLGAVDAIALAEGTRIDRALALAGAQPDGPNRRAGAQRVVVLMTDGRPAGGSEMATRDAAEALKAAGYALYVIGLGDDVDATLLRALATSERHYLEAPDASTLAVVYEQILGDLPCPGGVLWATP